jgi:hypothetical protein
MFAIIINGLKINNDRKFVKIKAPEKKMTSRKTGDQNNLNNS